MVATGCLADHANSNCSWISGDAIYLARTTPHFSASRPESANAAAAWEFWGGEEGGWVGDVAASKPVLTWKVRPIHIQFTNW